MKKPNLMPLALSLSIVAIVLSVYSTYVAGGLNFLKTKTEAPEKAAVSAEFQKEVYSVIDSYIAEKQGEAPQVKPTGPIDVSLDDDAIKGEKDAPVTIVEFTDFQCPYCERYFTESYGKIMENYVDTGKVKYVVRDFPLPFHPNALPAANAAECIRDQGGDDMYFKYHDLLFKNQTELSVDNYKKWATDFDIDQKKFATCVDKNEFNDEIQADMTEGQSYGVQGTPSIFVNGVLVQPSGAQPYAIFEKAIEAALTEADKK